MPEYILTPVERATSAAWERSEPSGRTSSVSFDSIAVWEMVHCRHVYAGMQEHVVLAGVLGGALRPKFDIGTPAALQTLAQDCWSQQPR